MAFNEYDALMSGEKVSGNEYDELVQDDSSFRSQQVQASFSVAAKGPDPDRQAKVLELSKKTGLPSGIVDRQFDLVSQRAMVAENDYDKIVKDNPGLAKWLENPDQATVSKDDLDNLKKIENITKENSFSSDLFNAAKSGAASLVSGTLKSAALIQPQDYVDPLFADMPAFQRDTEQKPIPEFLYKNPTTEYLDRVAAESAPKDMNADIIQSWIDGDRKKAIRSFALQVVSNMPQLAVIAATRGAGLAVLAASSAGQKLGQNLEQGVPQDVAVANAAVTGTIEAVTESFGGIGANPIKQSIKALSKGVGKEGIKDIIKGSLNEIFKTTLEEGAEEAVTSISQDVLDYGTGVSDNLDGLYQRAGNSFLVGAGAGGATTSISITPAHAFKNYKSNLSAQLQSENYKDLGEAIVNSKLNKRSADLQGAYVEQITKGTPVENIYISPDAFETYFQKTDKTASQVAQELGLAEEYASAKESGADIQIKLSEWTKNFVNTDHYNGLANDVKFSPQEMSVNEAKVEAARVEEVDTQSVEAQRATDESIAVIEQNVSAQLMETGVKQKDARIQAQLYGAAFRSFSEKSGMSASSLFERYGLKIKNQEQVMEFTGQETLSQGQVSSKPLSKQTQREGVKLSVRKNANNLTVEPMTGIRATAKLITDKALGTTAVIDSFETLPKYKGVTSDMIRALESAAARSGAGAIMTSDTRLGKSATTDTFNIYKKEGYTASQGKDGEIVFVKKLDASQSFMQSDEEVRGQIRFGKDRQFNIDLFKAKDNSTFIHETGHFLFEVMGDLAQDENAAQALKDDYATVLNWLGVEARDQVKTEQHEKFSRGFEAYLMEGKAPSSKLRKAFNTFKTWLTMIYKNARSLNADLSPEIRGVMDRILVADSETTAAEKSMNYDPLFADPKAMGMSDEKAAAYMDAREEARMYSEGLIRDQLMNDILKKQTAEYKDKRASVKEDITNNANNSILYRGLSILQTGKLADGTDIPRDMQQPTLSRESVVAVYGEQFANTLPTGIFSENGLPYDVTAELLGFYDGEQMIQEMANSVPKNQFINQQVDAEMLRLYPEGLTSPELPQEAIQAVHNDKRAKMLRLELEHLAQYNPTVLKEAIRRVARRVPTEAAVREQSQATIGKKQTAEIRPIVYQRAEVKAAKEAGQLLAKGDIDGAFEAKRRELLNHELYRSAVEARDRMDKDIKNWKRLFKKDEAIAKTRDVDIVNAARAVLAEFGISKSDKTADEYLSHMKSYDPDTYGTVSTLVDQATANAKDFKEVSYDQFVDMSDAVNALWDLSKSSREIEIDGVKMDVKEMQGQLEARIQDISKPGEKHKFIGAETTGEAIKTAFLSFRASTRRVEHWTKLVNSEAKEFTRIIWNPISEAADKYRAAKGDVLKEYRKTFDLLNKDSMTKAPIAAPEISPIPFKNKAELLGAILHTGNDSNFQKLLRGRGWGTLNEDGTLDRENWDKFISRMHSEGVLTKSDYEWAQSVWNLLETLKPDAQKAHKQMYGYYFNEITANSFETPFGTYKGGYVPAVADPTKSEAATIRTEKEQMERGQNSFMFPTTGKGFTKSRVEAYVAPLSVDINLVGGHIDKVLRFTHIEPRVKEVSRIVMNEGFRQQLAEYDPAIGQDMLVPWLQRAAAQRVTFPSGNGKAWKVADSVFNAIRLRSGMNIMTGNVINTLQNYTGIFVSASKVDGKYLRNATWDYVTNSKQLAEMASDKSVFMKNELDNSISESNREINQILVNPSKFETVLSFAQQHAYILQQLSQNQINTITWHGAYNQALERGLTEKEAVREADSTVRTTQSSLKAEDVSRYETGSPFLRMFSQFYSYFNNLANLNQTEFLKIARDVGLKKGAGKLFYLFMMTTYMPAVISEVVRRVAAGTGADDDDDGSYMDDFMQVFLGAPSSFLAAQVPILGTAMSALTNSFNDKKFDDRLNVSPSISTLENAVKAPSEVYDAIVNQKNPKGAIRDALTLVTLFSGVPLGIVSKPASYLIDVKNGDATPNGPVDFTRGLITGKKGD